MERRAKTNSLQSVSYLTSSQQLNKGFSGNNLKNLTLSEEDQKENTQNQIYPAACASSMSSFYSQSSEDSCYTSSNTPFTEETSTPTAEKRQPLNPFLRRGKDNVLFCESMKGSIDEAFLATRDSLDATSNFLSSSIDESLGVNRPSISETAYLMKSFSTDEMNAVRPISQNYGVGITSSTMLGSKKLSLINPSAMKGSVVKSSWQLMSPTDRNVVSPSKQLKRKYKSQSSEEQMFQDI